MRCLSISFMGERPAEAFALSARPYKASAHPFLDDATFEVGEYGQHPEHGLAAWCRRIDALRLEEQVHLEGV